MNTLGGRVGATIVAILLYGWINFLAYPAATLLTGQTAGQQFDNSNVAYFSSMIGMRIFGHLGIPFVLLLIVVVLIWFGPLRRKVLSSGEAAVRRAEPARRLGANEGQGA